MTSHVLVVIAVLLCFGENTRSSLPGVLRRFEYKLSFKGPHLVQRDGTIPFWEHSGHAIASDESIRITPSLRSKKGQVWSKEKVQFEHWEIELVFRISGRGRVGADGLALWYTDKPGVEGPVFGNQDQWNGLGVFFDSFDNDAQHNNPYIMAMVNDGTKQYDHNTDGANQQLSGCLRDFRNKPFPVRTKIEYYQKALTIYVHNGMTSNKDDYELCMRVEGVELPPNGHFGISAATGGLADDHDVQAFLTHSLKPRPETAPGDKVPDEERQKFEKEFVDYQQKLQQAKDDYRKEHPDKVRDEYEGDEKEWFESQDSRELKQIFEGQNNIHTTIRDLHRKMDEVIGRQERTLSQISMMGSGSQVQQGQAPPVATGGQMPVIDTIKRHEVDSVMSSQRELQNSLRDMRTLVDFIHKSTSNMGTGGSGGASYDGTQHHEDIKNHINSLQNDVRTIMNKPQGTEGGSCPTPSCITPFYFIIFIFAQMACFVAYAVYRGNKEASAKKFY